MRQNMTKKGSRVGSGTRSNRQILAGMPMWFSFGCGWRLRTVFRVLTRCSASSASGLGVTVSGFEEAEEMKFQWKREEITGQSSRKKFPGTSAL